MFIYIAHNAPDDARRSMVETAMRAMKTEKSLMRKSSSTRHGIHMSSEKLRETFLSSY
jgi:hypothetical protein